MRHGTRVECKRPKKFVVAAAKGEVEVSQCWEQPKEFEDIMRGEKESFEFETLELEPRTITKGQ
jgi:hypothetical protein